MVYKYIKKPIKIKSETSSTITVKTEVEFTKPEVSLDDIFSFFVANNFDLVPIQKGGKIPIEKEWTKKLHKDASEWKQWLKVGINMGLKTGHCSNVTVIDIDSKNIPKIVVDLFKDYKGVLQETTNGYHYFFQYESDLSKTCFDFEGIHIDIENNGGQVVICPSVINDIPRKFLQMDNVPKMSNDIKKFIKKNGTKQISSLSFEDQIKKDIKNENLDDIKVIGKGNRNNFLVKFGGVMRQKLNIKDTEFVMDIVNRHMITPALPKSEFDTIVKSLGKYDNFDLQGIALKVLEYIRIVPDNEATERDIREALGFKKKTIDNALSFLIQQQYIVKRRRVFHIIRKASWKEEFMDAGKEISFKFPYFYDRAVFRYGDMIVIGGKTGEGKTHIAMNMVKAIVTQNIRPYYITLESGNRFSVIAKQLGLVEGDFRWDQHYSPEHIELEKDGITFIDWLLPKDYANTDKLFEYFSQQLKRNGGLLIVFVQLRDNGKFFAEDMVKFFPSFVCKFLYEVEGDSTRSYFLPMKIREGKSSSGKHKIPTFYDWNSKELKRVDEEGV